MSTAAPDSMTFYEVLGVSPDAPDAEIKKAFRKIMKMSHPDVAQDDPDAAQRATDATIAYGTLSDPDKRAEYDKALAGPTEEELAEQAAATNFEDGWGSDWDASSVMDEGDDLDDGTESVLDDVEVEEDWGAPSDGLGRLTQHRGPVWMPQDIGEARLVSPPSWREPLIVFLIALVLDVIIMGVMRVFATPAWAAESPGLSSIALVLIPFLAWVAGIVMAARTKRTKFPPDLRKRWLMLGAGMVAAMVVSFVVPVASAILVPIVTFASAYVPLEILFASRKLRKELNRIVPESTLMESNRFGSLPGGVAADQIDLVLAELHKIPAVRVLLCENPDAWFSHAVILGRRVAFVRGIIGPGGTYRWSGPTLLADVGGNLPVEVLARTDGLKARVSQMFETFAEPATMLGVVTTDNGSVTGVEPTVQAPAVVDLDDLEDMVGTFLCMDGADPSVVDHEMVAKVWSVLNT